MTLIESVCKLLNIDCLGKFILNLKYLKKSTLFYIPKIKKALRSNLKLIIYKILFKK